MTATRWRLAMAAGALAVLVVALGGVLLVARGEPRIEDLQVVRGPGAATLGFRSPTGDAVDWVLLVGGRERGRGTERPASSGRCRIRVTGLPSGQGCVVVFSLRDRELGRVAFSVP